MKNYLIALSILFATVQAKGQSFQWAKTLTGSNSQLIESIDADSAGNIYTAGEFINSINFDPPSVTSIATGDSDYDVFLAKHSSSGNLIWYKNFGNGANPMLVGCVRVDPVGNIYLSGTYSFKTDFDPTSAVDTLNSAGSFGSFISKYDSSGNYIITRLIRNIGPIFDIVFEDNGNIILTGSSSGTIPDIDFSATVYPLPLPVSASHAVVIRYDSSWGLINAFTFGGQGLNPGFPDIMINSDLVIKDSLILITGSFRGHCDFDPGAFNTNDSTTTLDGADYDMFFALYDLTGNLIWKRHFGSIGPDYNLNSIIFNDSIYVIGRYSNTIDFDPSGSVANYTANGYTDLIFGCYDLNGNLIWAKTFGDSSASLYPGRISLGIGNSTLIVSGTSYSAVFAGHSYDIDPGSGTNTITSSNTCAAFAGIFDLTGNYLGSIHTDGNAEGYQSGHLFSNDAIYLCGYYKITSNFDPGFTNYTIPSTGNEDAFIAKYSSTSTSIHSFDKTSEIRCFPNPTSGIVNIISSDLICDISLVNSLGQKLITKNNIQRRDVQIDIKSLESGIYFVIIDSPDSKTCSRVIRE